MAAKRTDTDGSVREYSQAWFDKMVEIWRDRLDLMGIYDTGALRSSVGKGTFSIGEAGGTMAFRFLTYGIYVDLGTGNGYRHGNGGNLEFLGKAYRKAHRLGRARRKRPWFSPSWRISQRVLADHTASIIGDRFVGFFDEFLDAKP